MYNNGITVCSHWSLDSIVSVSQDCSCRRVKSPRSYESGRNQRKGARYVTSHYYPLDHLMSFSHPWNNQNVLLRHGRFGAHTMQQGRRMALHDNVAFLNPTWIANEQRDTWQLAKISVRSTRRWIHRNTELNWKPRLEYLVDFYGAIVLPCADLIPSYRRKVQPFKLNANILMICRNLFKLIRWRQ